ncbi:MAG TPA: hypothetical protein VMF51_18220 [Nocardioides sp.]|uniref:phage portal protein family protein n=1 Tax=Nocardioides sp. TaxID=35761 RepID=UPI002BFCCBB1|nr:hypothetical protein [Nocardioides sp.]HTW17072.1 hypothetical protein [Nocardioides sp.]
MTETTTEPAPSPVAVREKGYAHDDTVGGRGFWNDLSNEDTPELVWPLSIPIFDKMRRQDAQVSSVLRAVTSPILRTRWSVDGTGCRPEVTEFVASNLGLPIKGQESEGNNQARLRGRDRFSWNQHTRMALLMLPFGHMYFEQVYRYDEQGRARIRKLAPRMQRSISQINVARDGGLVSIEQYAPMSVMTGAGGSKIPVNRLVAYVLDREGGNWLGTSLLRSAYKNWLLKDRALRHWSIGVERNSVGLPVYTAAEKETSLEKGKAIATQARGGSNSGAALPHGAELALKGVEGQLLDPEKFVRYQDEQIARAVLAHFLNLGSQTGSWALGSSFKDFFTQSLDHVAGDYADTSNFHVVEDLVDINFGRTEPAPLIVFEPIGTATEVDDEISLLRKAAGLEDDDDLAAFLRQHVSRAAA